MKSLPKGARVVELGAGFRLRIHRRGYRWIECANMETLVGVLGEQLLNQFARCFEAAERIAAIEQMVATSAWLATDDLVRIRNFRVCFLFMVGTLFELQNVLTEMRRSGIEREIADPSPWVELDRMRKRWTRDDFRYLRNGTAFHLTRKVAQRGIDNQRALGAPAPLLAFRKPSKLNVVTPFSANIMLHGLDIDERDLERLMREVHDHAVPLSRNVTDLFHAVLENRGVSFQLSPEDLGFSVVNHWKALRRAYKVVGAASRASAAVLWRLSWRCLDAAAALEAANDPNALRRGGAATPTSRRPATSSA
jgi:hypothetical protein